MTDQDPVTTSSDGAAQRAAEQAKLRKQRREAKLKAGGASRLDKITGVGGRVVGDHATPSAVEPELAVPTRAQKVVSDGDPDEVDISEHFYEPITTNRIPNAADIPDQAISEAQLRQMMLGLDRTNGAGRGPAGGPAGMLPDDDDPLMKMMSQMMGGAGFPPGAEGAGPGANPFAGMMPPQQPAKPDTYATFWRLLHALVAIGLGFYLTLMTPFAGTKAQRNAAALMASGTSEIEIEGQEEIERHRLNFFWAFATAEAVLLTTRFFLDKNRAPPPGIAWTVVGYLPEPWKGYVSSIMKYGQFFTTVRTDILCCVFVLGICTLIRDT